MPAEPIDGHSRRSPEGEPVPLVDGALSSVGDLDKFFDIALDMLCISNQDGYFKRLNPAFSRTLGWTIEEMLTKPFIDFVHPDDVEPTLLEVQKQMEAGETVLHFENRYLHKDGSYRDLAWKSVPQPGGFMYAVARDVTERLRQEQDLRDKNTDLEQFTRAVAHDLRAPLRAIGSYAEILAAENADVLSAEARGDLHRINTNVAKMASIFDGLLRFSRAGIQELDKVPIDVVKMVEEAVREIKDQIVGRHVEFEVGPLPPTAADPQLMQIVLTNLISNAVKYTRNTEKAKVEVGYLSDGATPAYFVRDNGAGFDMKDVDRIFGVFERVHPISSYEGHGIGLATVYRIIVRHGGSIWAEGKEGEGATFYFNV